MSANLDSKTFRPSSLGRIARCPGSVRLCASLKIETPEDEELSDKAAAERGKQLHGFMASPDPAREEKELTSYDRSLLARARGYIDRLHEAAPETGECQSEVPLALTTCVGVPPEGLPRGTADWILWAPGRRAADIVDHKTGPNEPDEELIGPQVFAYAAMLFQAEAALRAVNVRVYHWASDTEYSRKIQRNELPFMVGRIREIILAALDENAKLVPSASGCSYCPALAKCPAAAMLPALPYNMVITPVSDGHALANAIDRAKTAQKHLEAFLDWARAYVNDHPGAAPGWKIQKTHPRKVMKPFAYFQRLRAEVGPEKALEAFEAHVTAGLDLLARHRKEELGGTLKQHVEEIGTVLLEEGIIQPGDEVLSLRPAKKEITDGN